MARYELAGSADRDLTDIYVYSAEVFGEQRADEYLLSLRDRFLQLAEMPSLARKADDIRPGYFRFEHESHIVFFVRIAEGIRVMRVLHRRMDVRRHV